MPSYKDSEKNTWYCKFYYQDWTGKRRQKLKRGFLTKREAAAWERIFLEKQQGTPEMSFQALTELYLEDVKPRIKESTYEVKSGVIRQWVTPYFKDKAIISITPNDIRTWHTVLLSHRSEAGKPFSQTYLRNIDRQLVAIFSYAVKYHNLPRNPHDQTGYIGKPFANRLDFWTLEQFKQFMTAITKPERHAFFNTLYYTGIRCGECLALTPDDIDLDKNTISITKTYVHLKGKTITTSPKTANSVRVVPIPQFLADELKTHMGRIYALENDERIFPKSDDCIHRWMRKGCKDAELPRMRIHALRHSHVSLLIELGFPALLIAERIGDNVEMINRIYGHLYPNRHAEVADKLQALVSK